MKKKTLKIGYSIFVVVFTILICLLNYRVAHQEVIHTFQPEPDIFLELTYLKNELHNGAAEKMQAQFPEGYVFMHALYGLSWAEVGRYQLIPDSTRKHAIKQAAFALALLESNNAQKTFDSTLAPRYGIFYNGWVNYLRASIFRIKKDDEISEEEMHSFMKACDTIAAIINSVGSPYPVSYKSSAWPADAIVAVASLSLFDHRFYRRYNSTINNWLLRIKDRLDENTKLLPHAVDAETGNVLQGARGSSQALILRFLPDIDTMLSSEMYRKFEKQFVEDFAVFPVVREYPIGNSGSGDIDSGPMFFGIGSVATIVAIGAARANGDYQTEMGLRRLIEVLGVPYIVNGRKTYGFGLMVIGEAFLCWSRTALPSASLEYTSKRKYSTFPFHLVSAFLLMLIYFPFFLILLKQRNPS